jgi:hypothetical protein
MKFFRLIFATIAGFSLVGLHLNAQPGSIVANPDAVKLKLYWALEGAEHGDLVGNAVSALGDIDLDGFADLLVNRGLWGQWNLFRGDSTRPRLDASWHYDSCRSFAPAIGTFDGSGQRFLVLAKIIALNESHLHLLRLDSGGIASQPQYVWNATRSDEPSLMAVVQDYRAVDLDDDGADELVCFIGFVRGEPQPFHSQIWIYRGGKDFQLNHPDVILRDQFEYDGFNLSTLVGDVDGDRAIDIAVLQRYTNRPNRLSLWFGAAALPVNGQTPDRVIDVSFDIMRIADVDGDSVVDVIAQGLVYRSGADKSARTRSFTDADADATVSPSRGNKTMIFGPLNNASRRYDMVGASYYDGIYGPQLLAYSGGPHGPDNKYDAVIYASDHGFLGGFSSIINGPAGDVNGDGWSDFFCAEPRYYDPGVDKGIVVILAGGPYIPVDDPSMGVREIVTGERPRALFLWPNPVRDHLNIAWRGDLRRMPSRFEVFDELGARIADGTVDEFAGGAIWRCGEVSAGTYMLQVLDAAGDVIGTSRFSKE